MESTISYAATGAAPHDLAIDLRDVAKRYRGKVDALKGIEMHVRRGEIFGLLGPNGAGKSTLVKIMMTIVRPTRAHGTVLGRPVGHKGTLARVGYLPENHRFPRYLTGRQIIEFFGSMSGVDRPTRRKRAGELIDLVGMADSADRKISTYSKGMAQRIGLAQALINDPALILLDEPTDGVDPVGRRDIRDVLNVLRGQGKTVFVNSHLLSELEMVCDRVAILLSGRVAMQGTIADLTSHQQRYEVEVAWSGDPQVAQRIATVLGAQVSPVTITPAAPTRAGWGPPAVGRTFLRGALADGTWAEVENATVRVGLTDPAALQPILDKLRAAGMTLARVQLVRPTLEDLFIEAVAQNGGGR
ncbi:MAG TPA: ATP-binding cassette domain-containing protein [Tepidisphaeraceae bacterium]|nr:ATP-binding cassette domain-containing protein [Tepidisphaeraceae bacterium]